MIRLIISIKKISDIDIYIYQWFPPIFLFFIFLLKSLVQYRSYSPIYNPNRAPLFRLQIIWSCSHIQSQNIETTHGFRILEAQNHERSQYFGHVGTQIIGISHSFHISESPKYERLKYFGHIRIQNIGISYIAEISIHKRTQYFGFIGTKYWGLWYWSLWIIVLFDSPETIGS